MAPTRIDRNDDSISEGTDLNSEIVYLLDPFAPVLEVQVAVEIVEGPVAAKGYLLAMEAVGVDGDRIGAQQISWPYSTQLDTPYTYIPATAGGHAEVARLKCQSPIASLRFWVVPWSGTRSESPVHEVFGRMVYRYWTVPAALGPAATTSFTGVVKSLARVS